MAMKATLFLLWFTTILSATERKMYVKEYDHSGNITAEGWSVNSQKTDFWTFYHKTGEIASKGHYKNDTRSGYWYFYSVEGNLLKEGHYENGNFDKWWIFYDLALQEKRKIQYQNNEKNGFCLIYKKNKLIKAEKYQNDLLTGMWDTLRSFRQDNPEVSLFSL